MPGMEVYDAKERKEVNDVLDTGALFRYGHDEIRKGMWKSKEFEAEVANYTGAKYAHAVSSGSTAVATLLAAAGIGLGDEIIVPPFTFIAPIEAAFLAGALPIFAEIDETLCLSPEGIEAALTPKTKAVLLVHMLGTAADIDGIMEVCAKHNLILIEDCGQAMGAFWNGKSVGLFGKVGSFSFDYFKITTCGEGGVIITNDLDIYNKIDQVADHGHTHEGNNRGMEPHHIMGFNYRISELSAAVGLAQMRKIGVVKANNQKNKVYLKNRLKEIPQLEFRAKVDVEGDSAATLNFFLPTADLAVKVIEQFSAVGISGAAYWFKNQYHFINQWDHIKNLSFPAKLAVHHFGAPQDYKNLQLPKSQDVMSRLVSLGIRATWTQAELEILGDKMVNAIKKVIG
jgi:8-amino-3,8-dideoxy-alpha-D-manno-octulosonate transaminase